MSAGYHHFIIEQGATFGQTLTLKDEAGSTINLVGFTGAMSLKQTPSSTSAILSLTTSNGRMTINGSAGTVALLISATDTANLEPSDGVYDLEITSGAAVVSRIIEGTFSIRRNITT
jgi:hypothetical protein|tara:strand:- start:259 stop:609 length:351 start_codon:yes stop_codon:yes gene_type:complete